jgi:hypothetical protein
MEQKPIYKICAIVAAVFLSSVVTMGIGIPYVMACIPAPGEGYACMSGQHHATIQLAHGWACHRYSDGGFFCDPIYPFGYTQSQQPQIQSVDDGDNSGNHCSGIGNCWGFGPGSGNNGNGDAFVQHPTTQQIAFIQVDDGCSGHWAFSSPPRCLSD